MSIRLLVILLFIQIAFIAAWSGSQYFAESETSENILMSNIKHEDIKQIKITDDNNNSVLIKREAQQWVLPDYYHLSVNQDQLQSLLNKVIQVNAGWAIAHSEGAAQRFFVSEKQFKRHLQLTLSDDQTADLYIGETAGLRKTYIRQGGSSDVYTIDIPTYMAPATEVEWFNKAVIKSPEPIVKIKAADFILEKTAEGWKLADNADSASLDQTRINLLTNYLAYPQVVGVAAADLVASILNNKPDAEFELDTEQQTISLQLFKTESGTVLRSSLSELHFIAEEYVAKNLLGMDRSALMVEDETEQETDQTLKLE
jgi:hypothetical protein